MLLSTTAVWKVPIVQFWVNNKKSMAKILHKYQNDTAIYANGIEFLLDSNEKIVIGTSSSGVKLYEYAFWVFPKLLWRCDNTSLIEKMFPSLKENFIGGPLEQIVDEMMSRFKTKQELLNFLENFKS